MRSGSAGDGGARSVLLVDIGNTRIKWTVWRGGRLGTLRAHAHTGWSSADYLRHVLQGPGRKAPRILVACVAGAAIERRFAAAARPVVPEFVATSRASAGVATRYVEPWRLGVDRFMAAIAAHHLAGRRGACVINVGTAVTLDLVDGRGSHLGGTIVPGPKLMIESLLRRTAGIAHRAQRSSAARPRRGLGAGMFARDTASAIERGAWQAVAGAVERAVREARRELGAAPLVILTGGGASELRRLVDLRHVEVPDLVLRGIALHAGLALKS